MSAVVELEWTFSPPDYFEELIKISRHDYAMTIANGKVEAKINCGVYDADPSIRQRLDDGLNDRFLGVQLLTHRAYELSKSTMARVHRDGRKHIFIGLEPARIVMSGGTVDIRVTDRDGNVVSDSWRDRIERKRSLAELVAKYRSTDGLLASLLRSYDAAVRDPNNELVHLYEIRDALSVRFGGEPAARAMLGIISSQWSRMGQLCNSEPLRQGRHRGKTGGALRGASERELNEGREIARAMIESYLRHLESSTSP
jgi:hypothetical protein